MILMKLTQRMFRVGELATLQFRGLGSKRQLQCKTTISRWAFKNVGFPLFDQGILGAGTESILPAIRDACADRPRAGLDTLRTIWISTIFFVRHITETFPRVP